jgi:SAM-dependent MidA family methyltransferase
MQACISDPEHGYWRRRDTIGAAGDFVTAPRSADFSANS